MARHWLCAPAGRPRRRRARRVARDRLPRAGGLRELRGAGGGRGRRGLHRDLPRRDHLLVRGRDRLRRGCCSRSTPALITSSLPIDGTGWFVVVEGLVRVTLFIAYLSLISLLPACGACSSTTPPSTRRSTPRGGRGADAGERAALLADPPALRDGVPALGDGDRRSSCSRSSGSLPWYWLIVTRILLLPVIAGIAYEVIRFAGKHSDNRVLMMLLAPGLWLQRLTTREPTPRPARGLDPRAPGGAPARGRAHARRSVEWR